MGGWVGGYEYLNKLNYYHEIGIGKHFSWLAKLYYKFVHDISDQDEKNSIHVSYGLDMFRSKELNVIIHHNV